MELGLTTEIVGGIAALTILAACWRHVKNIFAYIRGIIVVEVDLCSSVSFQEGIISFMKDNLKHFEISPDKQFESHYHFIQKDIRYKTIFVENLFFKKYLAFYKFRPFIFSSSNNSGKDNNPDNSTPTSSIKNKIYYIRGFLDLDQLLIDSVEAYNKHKISSKNFTRYEVIKYYGLGSIHSRNSNSGYVASKESVGSTTDYLKSEIIIGGKRLVGTRFEELNKTIKSEKSPFDLYAYPEYVKELVNEVVLWKNSKEWYAERDIEWRRGWLLHGKQGTGKTTLIKSIAQEIDVPIILFDLASMSNSEFNQHWQNAKSYGPCIVVFEDFDSVFSKRKNILGDAGGGLSFDSILNCLSGVDEANGIFLVVTTNKVNEIDEALGVPVNIEENVSNSTRPGRIDKTIRFGEMGLREKEIVSRKMLKDIDNIDINDIISQTEGYTASQFKEKCTEIALRHYWNSNDVIAEINKGIKENGLPRSLNTKTI